MAYLAVMTILIILGSMGIMFLSESEEELLYVSLLQHKNGEPAIYDSELDLNEEYHYIVEIFSEKKANYSIEIWLMPQGDNALLSNGSLLHQFISSHSFNETNIFNFTLKIQENGPYLLAAQVYNEENQNQILRETYIHLFAGVEN